MSTDIPTIHTISDTGERIDDPSRLDQIALLLVMGRVSSEVERILSL